MMDFFAATAETDHGLFDFLDLPSLPSTGLDHWSDQALSVDFALGNNALPLCDDINALSSPSSSSSDSPTSSPDALAVQSSAFIKSEPVSPQAPVAAPIGAARNTAKRQRSPAGGAALRIKPESRFSDDDSSDEAEFDPDAMPHPSIFTKTPSQLSKEELLSLTTKGLEEYERRIKTFHTLTNSEQNLLKRQRRLIKNRESAQQSRMRKKAYVQDLERHVRRLMSEKEELLRLNQDLSQKNENLVRQVSILQDAVRSYNPSVDPFQLTGANSPSGKKALPRATAGVCALVVLFSFALFFGMSSNNGGAPPAAIALSPSSGMSGPASASSEWNTGRLLTSMPSTNASFDSLDTIDDAIDIDSDHESLRAPDSPIVDITSLDDDEDQELASPASFIKQESHAIISSGYARSPSSIPARTVTEGSAIVRVRSDEKPGQRDIHLGTPSYIYCAEAQQLVPVETQSIADNDDYPLISLLLPASSLDTSLLRLLEPSDLKLGMEKQKDTLLELSCQVLSVEVFPLAGRGNDFGVVALTQ